MRFLALCLCAILALAGCAQRDAPEDRSADTPGGVGGDVTDDAPGSTGEDAPADPHDDMTPPDDDATQNVEDMLGGDLDVTASDVAYTEDRTGYVARPTSGGPYPGVVMIHEWWGLNDQIRQAARLLASHGYAVLAVDLFGSVATTQPQALAQVQAYDASAGVANMRDATAWLRTRENATSVSSLGWCFGGGQSLQLALSGEPLAGTVIYYGQLVNDTGKLDVIAWPVLGLFGGTDGSIPVASVRDFQAALNATGVENEIHVYPGVGHAFANPSGANWAPEETADAWTRTLAFLDENAT